MAHRDTTDSGSLVPSGLIMGVVVPSVLPCVSSSKGRVGLADPDMAVGVSFSFLAAHTPELSEWLSGKNKNNHKTVKL